MAKWPRKNDLGEDGTCLVSLFLFFKTSRVIKATIKALKFIKK